MGFQRCDRAHNRAGAVKAIATTIRNAVNSNDQQQWSFRFVFNCISDCVSNLLIGLHMTRRVVIKSSSSSPFRISAAGVDALSAEFNDLIFDGNQPPLRLWISGYTTVEGMSRDEYNGGQNIREGSGIGPFTTPSGTTPVFLVNAKTSSAGIDTGRVKLPTFNSGLGSGGGAICSGYFIGVSFTLGFPATPSARPPFDYINYAIFRNFN